jgi:hypothetical protein
LSQIENYNKITLNELSVRSVKSELFFRVLQIRVYVIELKEHVLKRKG